MLQFAGFELDRPRLELRRTGGAAIPLRPKVFDLLCLLAAQPRQVLTKQELMSAIWPNVYVGDDSLFQCIRELRLALGDDQRQLIRVVSGRGYSLDADVVDLKLAAAPTLAPTPAPPAEPADPVADATPRPALRLLFGRRQAIAGAVLGLVILAGAAAPILARTIFAHTPNLAVLPFTTSGTGAADMAANITGRLIEGLSGITNLEVTAPPAAPAAADYVLTGTVQQGALSWTAQARLTRGATGEVLWAGSLASDPASPSPDVQQSRLAAALGHDLALRLNTLLNGADPATDPAVAAGKVVVQQANAYITQQSRERFDAAQAMLEDGLARSPGNVDIQVALAAQLMRGVQMTFYSSEENARARVRARTILETALAAQPNSVPVYEAYCRFLATTNAFRDALVGCARTLTLDPWNGIALYHLGLAQLNLGRFDDALATFLKADSFDTPEVSRWTWKLGAGWSYLLMDRPAEALPWLQRAIAITPASGRAYFLLAAAYQSLGRGDEAAAAIRKGMDLRPGSSAINIRVPEENTSPLFTAAGQRVVQLAVAAGLPEQ